MEDILRGIIAEPVSDFVLVFAVLAALFMLAAGGKGGKGDGKHDK